MNRSSMMKAKAEAKRFLAAVKAVEDEPEHKSYLCASKFTGAMRRASMDLTRALADLRKP